LTTTVKKKWSPQIGPQYEVLSRSEKLILFGGARGGGKSEAGLAWLMEEPYISHPQYRSLVLRKDYEDLNDWIFRAKRFYDGIGEIVGKPAVIRWKGGGETQLGHWKDRDTISKYIGNEYHKMLCEELTQCIRSQEEFDMLMGSLRSSIPELRPQFLGTTNPGGPGHQFCKTFFVDKCRNTPYKDPKTGHTRIFIPSKATDNKILCKNDPEYVKWLEGLGGVLGSMWRDGDWETFEGQFFGDIGDTEQPWAINESDMRGHLFASLDGGTTHPTSFGLWYIDEDYVIHRLMTYCQAGGTHREHAQEIYERLEAFPWTKGYFPDIVWADPALWTKVKLNEQMVRSPIDEYIDLFAGKQRKTVFTKANNQKVTGCQTMKMLFRGENGQSGVRVWDTYNKSYLETLPLAQMDKNNPEIYAKFDGDDTCFVGETEIVTADGNCNIGDFFDGYVLTLDGFKYGHVKSACKSDLVRLTFDDGSTVDCTPEHLFLDDKLQWMKADTILGKTIYQKDSVCNQESLQKAVKSLVGIGSISHSRGKEAITSNSHLSTSLEAGYYTELYGNIITERFPRDTTSITRTGMYTTIPQTTLSCTPNQNTHHYICQAKSEDSSQEKTSNMHKRLQGSGTEAKQGTSGTSNSMISASASIGVSKSRRYANSVEKNTPLGISAEPFQSIAIQTVKPKLCVGVEKLRERKSVYCLTVPDAGHFVLGNGCVVHNCDEVRYGIVGCNSFIGQVHQAAVVQKGLTHREKLLRGDFRIKEQSNVDWVNL